MKNLIHFLCLKGWRHEEAFEIWNEYFKGEFIFDASSIHWSNDNFSNDSFYISKINLDIEEWECLMVLNQLPKLCIIRKK